LLRRARIPNPANRTAPRNPDQKMHAAEIDAEMDRVLAVGAAGE